MILGEHRETHRGEKQTEESINETNNKLNSQIKPSSHKTDNNRTKLKQLLFISETNSHLVFG